MRVYIKMTAYCRLCRRDHEAMSPKGKPTEWPCEWSSRQDEKVDTVECPDGSVMVWDEVSDE